MSLPHFGVLFVLSVSWPLILVYKLQSDVWPVSTSGGATDVSDFMATLSDLYLFV